MTDNELHNLCAKATIAGLKNNLVFSSDIESFLAAQGVPARERTEDKLQLPKHDHLIGKDKKFLLKAKIMLDSKKLRGAEKLPQSRGYAFADFSSHIFALSCLRELNNNSDYSKFASAGKDAEGKVRYCVYY